MVALANRCFFLHFLLTIFSRCLRFLSWCCCHEPIGCCMPITHFLHISTHTLRRAANASERSHFYIMSFMVCNNVHESINFYSEWLHHRETDRSCSSFNLINTETSLPEIGCLCDATEWERERESELARANDIIVSFYDVDSCCCCAARCDRNDWMI